MNKDDYLHVRVTEEEKAAVRKLTKGTKLRSMSLAVVLAVEFALHYKDIFRDYLKMRED